MILLLFTGEKMEEKEINQQSENINNIDDEILDLNIDPVTELNDNTAEDALQQYFKSISAYKPLATVFEMAIKKP